MSEAQTHAIHKGSRPNGLCTLETEQGGGDYVPSHTYTSVTEWFESITMYRAAMTEEVQLIEQIQI